MEINRHNYEAFLLDLLEGNLSVEDQQQVHSFLLLNPDCARELMDIEPWVLEGEELSFHNKDILRKELPDSSSCLDDHNFDLFSIARMEGDLSDEQESTHQAMLSLDDLKFQQWMEWQQTRLQPGKFEFKGKDQLKRKGGSNTRIMWISVVSTAAAIALLFILFRTGPDISPQEQALQTPQDLSSGDLISQQAEEVAVQADIQTVQSSPDPPVQKAFDPILFSVRKEHERPSELGSEMTVMPQDDLKTRLLPGSAKQITAISPAVEVASDKIEALYVPPVPVHLSSLSVSQISEIGLQEVLEEYTREKDISILSIANAGIKGINKLAGSDLSLLASRDEEGEVSGFRFKGKRFSLTKPIRKEE